MAADEIRAEEIRGKIKQIISNVTNIPVAEIADDASYVEDLNLDSLSLMGILVRLSATLSWSIYLTWMLCCAKQHAF